MVGVGHSWRSVGQLHESWHHELHRGWLCLPGLLPPDHRRHARDCRQEAVAAAVGAAHAGRPPGAVQPVLGCQCGPRLGDRHSAILRAQLPADPGPAGPDAEYACRQDCVLRRIGTRACTACPGALGVGLFRGSRLSHWRLLPEHPASQALPRGGAASMDILGHPGAHRHQCLRHCRMSGGGFPAGRHAAPQRQAQVNAAIAAHYPRLFPIQSRGL
mmetsp:Transcript_25701/g.66160  ORF Transcript_25701/g.66160 Transcript_25701/m.66160 type:complete len:216 (-) Transcript_25701:131-778(-)